MVRSFYCSLIRSEDSRFPLKSVRWTKVPLRVAFFAWLEALGKRNRHVIVVDRWYMCKQMGNLQIIFFFIVTWLMSFGLPFLVVWFCHGLWPRCVVNMYACWWTSGNTWSVAMWKMVSTCLLWCLWREMNDKCFEEIKSFSSKLCIFKQPSMFLF